MVDRVRSFAISRMTGCVEDRVPRISFEDGLSESQVKVVNLSNCYPLYGELCGLNYGSGEFFLRFSGGVHSFKMSEFFVFAVPVLSAGVSGELNSVTIINGELFTVVFADRFPVWVGDDNLVYYSEDIQLLVDLYGFVSVDF